MKLFIVFLAAFVVCSAREVAERPVQICPGCECQCDNSTDPCKDLKCFTPSTEFVLSDAQEAAVPVGRPYPPGGPCVCPECLWKPPCPSSCPGLPPCDAAGNPCECTCPKSPGYCPCSGSLPIPVTSPGCENYCLEQNSISCDNPCLYSRPVCPDPVFTAEAVA